MCLCVQSITMTSTKERTHRLVRRSGRYEEAEALFQCTLRDLEPLIPEVLICTGFIHLLSYDGLCLYTYMAARRKALIKGCGCVRLELTCGTKSVARKNGWLASSTMRASPS
jgi:hypothetical protein